MTAAVFQLVTTSDLMRPCANKFQSKVTVADSSSLHTVAPDDINQAIKNLLTV